MSWMGMWSKSVGWMKRTLGGLVADGQRAAGDSGEVGDGELLPDLTVGVRDGVRGVGVDAEQAGDLDVEAGFFFDLADGHC